MIKVRGFKLKHNKSPPIKCCLAAKTPLAFSCETGG